MEVRLLKVVYGEVIANVDGRKIFSDRDVANILKGEIGREAQEVFCALYLDNRHRLLAMREISRGTLSASLVHPRETFNGALLCNAAAIIIGHNHPSGDTNPSQEDRIVTQRLVDAGEVMGVRVLDHVVIGSCPGSKAPYSFREKDIFPSVRVRV